MKSVSKFSKFCKFSKWHRCRPPPVAQKAPWARRSRRVGGHRQKSDRPWSEDPCRVPRSSPAMEKGAFFFYKFTVVKSSSNPGDYEAFKLNLADWNRSNQPHYPSPGDDFSFSKISWVSAVGLWPGPTGLYSLSLCCVSVPLSGSHQSLMSRNKANTKAYCTCRWKNPGVKREGTWRYLKIFVGWDR